jgi:hypothetical protein
MKQGNKACTHTRTHTIWARNKVRHTKATHTHTHTQVITHTHLEAGNRVGHTKAMK